jgi:hypothetical protein
MLLWFMTVAHAAILDAGLLGARVGVHDSGDVAVGPTLVSLPGGLDIYALFGPETEALPVLRRWEVAVGGWAPDYLSDRRKRKADRASKKNARPGTPPPTPPPEKLVVGAPLLALGGNAWEGERVHAEIGGVGLVNLLQPAGVAAQDAYAGVSFGGGSRVRYFDGASAGEGALLVHAGLGGGGHVGDVLLVRAVANAELEPLVLDLRLRGDLLVGVSLLPADAPVTVQVRVAADVAPLQGWAPSGEAGLSLGFGTD